MRVRHTEPSIRTLLCDQLAVAAEAVVQGSECEAHWATLAAFAERDGVDHVAQALARQEDFRGPSREWWRCTLLLSTELSAEDVVCVTRELAAVEEAGGGPAFNVDRHALQVSAAMRFLEAHLKCALEGSATMAECSAVGMVVQAVRVAKARRG